ncbi:hypothetical protein [Comamonas sp. JC664]|uniref:hypothetical protein n=1 Tax=Comamonas sp. JC664 TaxID=2801917 RepID=UPI00174DC1E2|nr:hypothetical protein [Comamonas sp. JC664]MBL0698973.1 hypothetical protein [Comamonas sp. JC664]GHG79863.1 hypothetical protein GCM10012319_32160 [Comamonas sp. KCTC 72670]
MTLDDLCDRLERLAPYWREGEAEHIPQCISEARALPARKAEADTAQREAAEALARLAPAISPEVQDHWRELHRAAVRCELALAELANEERALRFALSCELWHARTAHWATGVAKANAGEP